MMKNFAVVNKNAKNYSRRELGRLYDIFTSSENLTTQIIATPSLSYLEELLEEHQTFSPDILGIAGGDGTASRTLTLVRKIWKQFPEYIAPLPMGTMNDYAIPLGLGQGLLGKLKQQMSIEDSPPIRMAEYIRDSAEAGKKLRTRKLALLRVNERSGFNMGFGIVPKLLWLYYGKTIEQHKRLEKELQQASSNRHERIFGRIFSERNVLDDLIDIVSFGNGSRKSGVLNSFRAGYAGIKGGLLGALGIQSVENDFFNEELDVEVYVDGNKVKLLNPPTAIMTASYRQINLGIEGFYPKPVPEAEAVSGKMQVVITSLTPTEIATTQIPKVFRGDHLKNTRYFHAEELRIKAKKPISCLVDGDFTHEKDFLIRYDQPLNFISFN
ncbi:MAG: diacylglycerol kinase family protein [Nanoarchaeota archaeon]|nr:hypothetical protein [Nanoarchaeota archaeon]MBU1631966.1 hypothetical protein [Nanoarchaeota archaeon]MBU1876423.1 hypothetical protein [Nanoarchaeota archaeon]